MKLVQTSLVCFLVGAAVILATAPPGSAQTKASATAKVVVNIRPSVAVEADAAIVDAGSVRTGEFSATLGFRVRASGPTVALYVRASELHKGDTPGGSVAPIPLETSRGATITASGASPLSGTVAPFTSVGTVGGFPTWTTASLSFQSPGATSFHEDVRVTVSWRQDDTAKPPGEYAGRVQLTAMVLP
jgi:hypothetical protein